jgi:hypothetical protein
MANRGKLTYIAGFVVLCWVIIAAVVGIFIGLAHLLHNSTAAVVVFDAVIYSAVFGFIGAQAFKWKGKRDGWPSHNGKGAAEDKTADQADNAEDGGWGWK